ncbi:hypothetical protein HK101_003047, partial [Irineochytrium annulatum]
MLLPVLSVVVPLALVASSAAAADVTAATAPATATTFFHSADANTMFAFVTSARPTYSPGAKREVRRDAVTKTLTMYIEPRVTPVVESQHYADDDYFVLGDATAALVGISPT